MSPGTPAPTGEHSAPPAVKAAPPPPAGRAAKSAARPKTLYVVVTGNPNCGKTTLFNSLTGLRAKVGNYAGVTVERKEGKLLGAPADLPVKVLDLPGTYSLSPQSLDEQVSRDVLLNRLPDLPAPALAVIVVDASNLQRNLYYATQVIELGYPTVIALNMIDVAENQGLKLEIAKLAEELGVPIVGMVASRGQGLPELRNLIVEGLRNPRPGPEGIFADFPGPLKREVERLADHLQAVFHENPRRAQAEALLLIGNEKAAASASEPYSAAIKAEVGQVRQRLEAAGIDWRSAAIEARYARVAAIQHEVTVETAPPGETRSDRIDRVLTHKIWGTSIFLGLMLVMFQSIFTFAKYPMEAIQAGVDWLGGVAGHLIPPGDLNSLLIDGVIAGVGAVVVFLPQILLLFLFIGFLEDTGYMARAAFLMDRLMSKVGLHGKSFIPMLSSFACAIPGIMASRTIESPKDRLITILISPLMSCSARLPVYTLLIAACIPNLQVFGPLRLPGLTMLVMYLLGVVVALIMAWLFKRTFLKSDPPLLILELPPYKWPLPKQVLRHMWERSRIFLRQAGTVILGINIVLWFLATYPRDSAAEKQFDARRAQIEAAMAASPTDREAAAAELSALDTEKSGFRLRNSFAGRLGRLLEPAIAPLGFDWKIGIGIVSSFAAREVFVSTMSTVYNVGGAEEESSMTGLVKTFKSQRRPDGSAVYTPLLGATLMVFYVFALQCVSTIAIVRRETNSWRWPMFQWLYMAALAWGFAFATWRLGHWFGFQ